ADVVAVEQVGIALAEPRRRVAAEHGGEQLTDGPAERHVLDPAVGHLEASAAGQRGLETGAPRRRARDLGVQGEPAGGMRAPLLGGQAGGVEVVAIERTDQARTLSAADDLPVAGEGTA